MGWNAYAIGEDGRCVVSFENDITLAQLIDRPEMEIFGASFINDAIDAAFQEAFEKVKQIIGRNPDRFLRYGGLDLAGSVEMLQRATRSAISDDPIWEPSQVETLNQTIDWGFPPEPSNFCEYWSARMFFQVCVEQQLGIYFFTS